MSSSSSRSPALEALRPQSLEELHATVAAGSSRRGKLPPIVNQLAEFCQKRDACSGSCVDALREQAEREAMLVPGGSTHSDPRAREIAEVVRQRFSALEERCSVLCGQRYSHLVGGGAFS
mmetsp:Transcript_74493/g.177389  ORF Transcript_74493/g.177389 Transcript_74493/m.177389 type:complete len:120 (-) Transcript_74493:108-467(-)